MYDHKKFKLHGRMDLEIGFDEKVVKTPIYIKMDAHDQLLLSEGVCSHNYSTFLKSPLHAHN